MPKSKRQKSADAVAKAMGLSAKKPRRVNRKQAGAAIAASIGYGKKGKC